MKEIEIMISCHCRVNNTPFPDGEEEHPVRPSHAARDLFKTHVFLN